MALTPAERNLIVLKTNRKRQLSQEIRNLRQAKTEIRNRYRNWIDNTNNKNQKAEYRMTRDLQLDRLDRQIDDKAATNEVLTNEIRQIRARARVR